MTQQTKKGDPYELVRQHNMVSVRRSMGGPCMDVLWYLVEYNDCWYSNRQTMF